jgi:aspartyl-tRNA(Asn)/glutamyl-tRNA(Gln) amidotransferase subunit A
VTDLSLSISALHQKIVAGEISATSLCEAVLTRIEQREPNLGAMSDVIAESALKEANIVDRALSKNEAAGALAGIPIAVKNNINTVPAICSAGLPHLSEYRPTVDADVVTRLRRAGAVIVGSTATDSGGFGVTSPSVLNPNFPDRVAGGSSGGSAAAVAAGLCKAAIGTDTGGSIRIPAACCGIVGFKPTYGRVSTAGVRPLASSVDHVGVLASSVSDIRSVAAVIDPDFTSLPNGDPARAAPVIGIAKAYVEDASGSVACGFGELVKQCENLGYVVREVELPAPQEILDSHLVLSLTEAALLYLDSSAELVDSLPAAAKDGILAGLAFKGYEHIRALRKKHDFLRLMQEVFSKVDYMILPTMPVFAPVRGGSIARIGGVDINLLNAMIRYTAPFDQSGHPALALPWRSPKQEDVGSVQLIGPLNSDRDLLRFAELLESQIEGLGNATIA